MRILRGLMSRDAGKAELAELAERWRVAGKILRRVDPVAFEALLAGAEVMALESMHYADLEGAINSPNKVC